MWNICIEYPSNSRSAQKFLNGSFLYFNCIHLHYFSYSDKIGASYQVVYTLRIAKKRLKALINEELYISSTVLSKACKDYSPSFVVSGTSSSFACRNLPGYKGINADCWEGGYPVCRNVSHFLSF